jgi:hypothetical protein
MEEVSLMLQSARHPNRLAGICAAIAILFVCSVPTISRAELTSFFGDALAGSSGTMSWPGTTWIHDAGLPDVNVYYAIFALSTFEKKFNCDLASTDPYVYTYQLDNADDSPQAIIKFTVGLYANAMVAGTTVAEVDDPLNGAGSPASSKGLTTGATSVYWNFSSTKKILAGGKSKILLFTSPHSPTDGKTCSVTGTTSIGETGPIPSPSSVPEPSTLLLLAIGGLGLALLRPTRSMLS